VIGGGDYATDRIIPDCIRAAINKQTINLRNPHSVRPYQHVLDCLAGYLLLAQKQAENHNLAGAYNFGPDELNCISTGDLATLFCTAWGNNMTWKTQGDAGPHEANLLKLDCAKAKNALEWMPKWNVKIAVEKVVEFAQCNSDSERLNCINKQIKEYFQ
jgi:CDP-glucose 4,6-dehydratase